MPRDSGGTYSLPANTLAVSGDTISDTYYNAAVNDFATEFTASLPVDGRKALTGKLLGYAGTASSPSFSFSSDTDTGIYPHGSGGLGVAVDGTLKVWFKTDGTIADGSSNTLSLSSIATGKVLGNISGSSAFPTAVSALGLNTIYCPATGMVSRTTNGPASGSVETSTNKVMIKTLDFDASTIEYAQFSVAMPKSWNNGTVTAVFHWSHAATTTNFGVVWGIQGAAFSDGDSLDGTAFGTAVEVTDTGGNTSYEYISSTTAACTIAGSPATGDRVVFQIYRKASDGSDTLAVDARLHGVKLYYTNSALVDD